MTRIVPLVVILMLAACSRDAPAAASAEQAAPAPSEAQAVATPAQEPPPPAPVPAQLPEIVARVNGEAISKGDLELAVSQLEARAGRPVPPEQRDRVIRGVLDELIGYRLLRFESVPRKVVVPDAEIEARIGEIRAQFPSEEAFTQTLGARGLTLAGLRTQAREGMQIDALLRTAITTTPVTPEQITAFYNENPGEFQQPERVRASHILIGVPEGADPAAKQQALAKAVEV